MKRISLAVTIFAMFLVSEAFAQELPLVRGVEAQPFMAQVLRLEEALSFLGSSLAPEDEARLAALRDRAPDESVVEAVQQILDPYCLAMVEINPEARVKVVRGPAEAELIETGWRSFLVKVHNDADVNAELVVESPNAMPILHRSSNRDRVQEENVLTAGQIANRFLELAMYQNRPLQKRLSGVKLEYAVLQVYSREAGRREAKIGFHVGQGTQDIGFRNTIDVLFDVLPAVDVIFLVEDENGRPTMGSFVITDGVERLLANPVDDPRPENYRHAMARKQPWDTNRNFLDTPAPVKRLIGIYPLPSRRIAMDATPILKWGQSQGGVVGYSHSGWGLEPEEPTTDLPNYVTPKMDGIGANEYIVTVTQDAVDIYSAGDTPILWELNMWYHTLNVGFRTRISGETDFPCIYDNRVGMARSYAKLEGELEFDSYMGDLVNGRSYVSDGKSHIIDFKVNERELGTQGSELHLDTPRSVSVTARVAAYLPEEQDEIDRFLASRPLDRRPYWDISRARLGESRRVSVELVVNGESVATKEIVADGDWTELMFEHDIEQSSWVALRILATSHTNPIFVLVDNAPIRASRQSAEWCRRAVDRCWEMKSPRIRPEERDAASRAYDEARKVYDRILQETTTR